MATTRPIRSEDAQYGEREDVEALDADEAALRATDAYPPRRTHHARDKKGTVSALSLGLRRHKVKIRLLVLFIVLEPLFFWSLFGWLLPMHPALFPRSLRTSNSTLVVVAHPDDECLFFSPSILAATKRVGAMGAVLVLSSGDHYGLGEVRRKELKGSCEELGVRPDRCDVMNVPDIQDDPDKWWPVESIIPIVESHVSRWSVDAVVTFDRRGVSGHINHRAVSAALTQYALSPPSPPSSTSDLGSVPRKPAVFVSETVMVARKYSGLYDLPFAAIPLLPSLVFGPSPPPSAPPAPMDPPYNARTEREKEASEARRRQRPKGERGMLVGGLGMYASARNAFHRHESQLVWDRYLYMILSRYMYFNTVEQIV